MNRFQSHGAEWAAAGDMAVVVFSDRADLWWLRFLSPGFRHCFVIVFKRDHALSIESLATGLAIADLGIATPHALASAFRLRGHRALMVPCRGRPRHACGPAFFSCVETVKRTIGIVEPGVVTPRQLWNYFCRNRKKILTFQI